MLKAYSKNIEETSGEANDESNEEPFYWSRYTLDDTGLNVSEEEFTSVLFREEEDSDEDEVPEDLEY